MPMVRMIRLLAAGTLLALTFAVGGCSSTIADMQGIGLPSDAPARAKEAGGYLPVHDLPPERDEAAMKPAEQNKIEKELIAARDHQATAAAGK